MIDKSFFENHFKEHSLNRNNFRYFSEIILDSIAEKYYQEIIQINNLAFIKIKDEKKLKLFIKKEVFQKSILYVNTILNHYIDKNKNISLNINYNEITKFLYEKTDKELIKITFKHKYSYFFNFYTKLIFIFFISFINKILLNFFFKKNNNYLIGVSYVEGIDINKRNDFFWYDKKLFFKKCLIYFNSVKDLNEFHKLNNEEIDKSNIKIINPFKVRFNYFNFSFSFILWFFKLISNYPKKKSYFFLFLVSMNLNLNKWYNFFKFNNIKIHYENQEGESSHIIKNISLDYLNGFSFSKERTLMSVSGPLNYYGSFSADVRFHNNHLSIKNFYKTHNVSKFNLLSYYPYKQTKSLNSSQILNFIHNKKFSKKIIFFDSNHSPKINLNELAMLPSSYMREIYEIFIDLIENYNICLIIKSKKINHSDIIFKNNNFKQYLNKNIFIIESPFGITAESLNRIADFSIAVGTNLSSALIEFISFSNKSGLFLNYHETYQENNFLDFLKKDNLVINNLSYFKKLMISYLEGNNKIGSWDKYLKDISIKSPNIEGNKRISYFLDTVFNQLSENQEIYLEEAVKKYNDKFS